MKTKRPGAHPRDEWAEIVALCCVDGCDRFVKLGSIACAKHVRQRKREIKRYGFAAVAARAAKTEAT